LGFAGATVVDGEAVSNRLTKLPQAESVSAAHKSTGAAERRRPVISSRRPKRSITSTTAIVEQDHGPTCRIMASSRCFRMIFSENRSPLFRIMPSCSGMILSENRSPFFRITP
jgi:hypothetical protein